jgi:hypothetical protein
MKNVQLSLNTAELMILGKVLTEVTRSLKVCKITGFYVTPNDFEIVTNKKEAYALRSIARKLGVK